jgi:hypothetical protein
MKKYMFAGFFAAAALFAVYFFFSNQAPKGPYAVGSAEWKYYTAEAETKVRPSTFESMKYHQGDGPELRSPASPKHK